MQRVQVLVWTQVCNVVRFEFGHKYITGGKPPGVATGAGWLMSCNVACRMRQGSGEREDNSKRSKLGVGRLDERECI